MFIAKQARRALIVTTVAAAVCSQAGAAVYNNGNKQSSFDVTMGIVADCTIATNAMDFGAGRGVLATSISATSAIKVTCTNTTPFNLGLNAGTGTGSSGTTRFMNGTGANAGTVKFNLLQAAGGAPWGDTQGSNTMGGTGSGTEQTLTVYGEIPAQNTPAPDTYKSTITATVYF